MIISILKNSDYQTTSWAGGTTTQLYILPKGASYAERNFDIRISTAKVELGQSAFTALPGINRKLMVLAGEIEIRHENQYRKQLKPFDVETFKGDWTTTAIGTCTDFNVMTNENYQSDLFGFHLAADSKTEIAIEAKWNTVCIYVVAGSLQIGIEKIHYQLAQGDLLVIRDFAAFVFLINSMNSSQIAVTTLKLL
jgi:environmental stress-induced protein Ves